MTKNSQKKISLSHDQVSYDHWLKMVKLFNYVGKICWLTHIVYFGDTSHGHLCPCAIKLIWGNLSLKVLIDIINDIVQNLKVSTQLKKHFGIIEDMKIRIEDSIVCDAISMTILLADQNHLIRSNLFSTLFTSTRFLLTNMKNISYYVAAAQRENDKITFQKVMPFIQFCLKSLDEEPKGPLYRTYLDGSNSYENVGLKLQFVTLKNSLTIMHHFKSNGRKEEY